MESPKYTVPVKLNSTDNTSTNLMFFNFPTKARLMQISQNIDMYVRAFLAVAPQREEDTLYLRLWIRNFEKPFSRTKSFVVFLFYITCSK